VHTAFQEAEFSDCKLTGVRFDDCNPFLLAMHFSHCILNLASFYQLKLNGARMLHCNLQEADFTEAELKSANFEGSQLHGTVFYYSTLEKADFRNAFGYIINPSNNKVKGAKFSRDGLDGLLKEYGIKVE
jgi:uncharacterized protein YjbI with pentapeptide repeats